MLPVRAQELDEVSRDVGLDWGQPFGPEYGLGLGQVFPLRAEVVRFALLVALVVVWELA